MWIISIFIFVKVSSAQDAPDFTSGEAVTSSPTTETKESGLSPFYSCSSLKSFKGPIKTNWLSTRVPEKDKDGNKTRDFLIELQKRIEVKAQQNLDLSGQVAQCFHRPSQVSENFKCTEMRTWLDPKKYPSGRTPEKEDTLTYNIKLARANLALADPNVDLSKSLTPNANLKPYGYKSVPWEPLTSDEKNNALNVLNGYKEQYKTKHNLSEEAFNKLIKPYDRSSENQIYANPMNISEAEMQDRLLGRDRKALERFFTKARTQHLENYRAILARYPIINYLSTANPSAQEVHTAGLRLQDNAKKEMAQIKEIGKLLNNPPLNPHPRQPDTSINNSKILNLMDYRSIVEELLAEHPQYCAVATTAELQREKRAFRNALLIAAPLLAVCAFAPPLAAVAISGAAGSAIAYSSYLEMVDQRQGAYTAPVVGDSRSDQTSVDEAREVFKTDVVMIPLQIIP